MKISEIKERKIIHRPTQNFDEFGKRIYQEFEYDFDFDTQTEDNYAYRLFAKILDLIPVYVILCFLLHLNPLSSFFYSILIIISLNSFLEWKFGDSIGKRIFNLKVVDDFGNFPTLGKSFKRNILSIVNLFPEFYDFQDQAGVWGTRMKFSMDLNSRFSKTYVIKQKIYDKIRKILGKKTVI